MGEKHWVVRIEEWVFYEEPGSGQGQCGITGLWSVLAMPRNLFYVPGLQKPSLFPLYQLASLNKEIKV